MSADEFDDMPDDFADISGVDWARILAGPSSANPSAEDQNPDLPGTGSTGEGIPILSIPALVPSSSSSSSDNFQDEYEDFDPSLLAELDRIEGELGKAIGFYIL
jgi:hypothetical protein